MIDIQVNGQPLALPDNLSLTLEQTAPWFDLDNILSDVVYTFDLPAEPNRLVLDHADSTLVSHHRRYRCQIFFAACLIADGYLYVQSSTDELHLSCGFVSSAVSPGWGDKPLRDTITTPDIEIGHSIGTYKSDWLQFLADSAAPDSDIRFPLFADDAVSFPEHGYFRDRRSPLQAKDADNIFISYLNRLFFAEDMTPINKDGRLPVISADVQGLRVFNDAYGAAEGKKFNGYHFLPALRLVRVIRELSHSSGLSLSGSFLAHPDVQQLYIQSLCALDGERWQYPDNSSYHFSAAPNAARDTSRGSQFFYYQNRAYNRFDISSQLQAPFVVRVDAQLPPDNLLLDAPLDDDPLFASYSEAYFLVISRFDAPLPTHRYPGYVEGGSRSLVFGYATDDNDRILFRLSTDVSLIQLTPTEGYDPGTSYDPSRGMNISGLITDKFAQYYLRGNQLRLRIAKARIYTTYASLNIHPLPIASGFPPLSDYNGSFFNRLDNFEFITADTPINIFARTFRWSEHMPDLTNSQFIAEIGKFFALAPFFGASERTLQISLFSDILKSRSFPIDEYLTSVTRRHSDTRTTYRYRVSSTASATDIPESSKIPAVDTLTQLPDAYLYKGRYCFVRNENRYYHSERDADTPNYSWQHGPASDDALVMGPDPDSPTDISSQIAVPIMRTVDTAYTHKYIQEDATNIISPLLSDRFDGKFPMHLTQFRGLRTLPLNNGDTVLLTEETEAIIEYANPTNYNPDGSIDPEAISLTATGDRSVGEIFVRPYIDFLANKEDFEFTLHLPINAFLTMLTLLRPQRTDERNQLRWLSYRSQRYLPSKITYTLSNADSVIAVIVAHRHNPSVD